MNLADLVSGFARLDPELIGQTALAAQGEALADKVREAFSTAPGGPHGHPWCRTGELRDSIGTEAEANEAIVASASQTALYQEHGTAALPPRPTFGPLATEHGEAIAHAIASALTAAIRSA